MAYRVFFSTVTAHCSSVDTYSKKCSAAAVRLVLELELVLVLVLGLGLGLGTGGVRS